MLLERIQKENDIKQIPEKEWRKLAAEIRRFLIRHIAKTGGHLASNLGTVELTMALHLFLELPKDKLIWDVGHQSYTHKILTGRQAGFTTLRSYGGMSGFPKHKESDCDAFDTGHASTSLSAGLGYAMAAQLTRRRERIVSVIGDGALTGGMAFEALNNATKLRRNFIMVLNDNTMSIAPNVGGISSYLGEVRTAKQYVELKNRVVQALSDLPGGKNLINQLRKTKNGIKQLLIPGMLFENLGITYLGPIDGHDIKRMLKILHEAEQVKGPVLIHVITKKGKGYEIAESQPELYHGITPFDPETGKVTKPSNSFLGPSYTTVFAEAMVEEGKTLPTLVGITAAMPQGTGLDIYARQYPSRVFDVGIAEEHAVTFAGGLAMAGMIPVVAIYSSFLQRAYDQIIHDICIQNLHVIFAVDRSGLVGNDGETHQGLFDTAMLCSVPNMIVLAPKNGRELKEMLHFAVHQIHGPVAIKYPRGEAAVCLQEFQAPLVTGRSEVLYRETQIALLAVGHMVPVAEAVRRRLKDMDYQVSLVNMRFIKPWDTTVCEALAADHSLIVTMEESLAFGSLGEQIAVHYQQQGIRTEILPIAISDCFVEHGDVKSLQQELAIDCEAVAARVVAAYLKQQAETK